MKIDLDRVNSRLALPEGWSSNVYDEWKDVHDAYMEVVTPGNEGAGYVVFRVSDDGSISSVRSGSRQDMPEVGQVLESLQSEIEVERRLVHLHGTVTVPKGDSLPTDDMHFEADSDRPGTWSATFTGMKFWHLDPRPDEVCLDDVAHGLSQLCRFSGQTNVFYSVAEHSVRCAELAMSNKSSDKIAMMALMHDAAEAYCSDVPRPLKLFLTGYAEIEASIQAVITAKLGGTIPSDTEAQIVKWLDNTPADHREAGSHASLSSLVCLDWDA